MSVAPGASLDPVVLEGRAVRLEPLERGHLFALADVGLDPILWSLIPTPVRDLEGMRRWVETALQQQAEGSALPFVTRDRSSGTVIGSSRFCAWDAGHRRVEIGWTWLAPAWQRTAANTEAKFLMLRHAFEVLGCHRVEFKTDRLNVRSRAAILRLGATEEGTFRKHMITSERRVRDTVYFSVIDSEWPEVRARLLNLLDSGAVRPA